MGQRYSYLDLVPQKREEKGQDILFNHVRAAGKEGQSTPDHDDGDEPESLAGHVGSPIRTS